jgi:hypothetical protein
MTNASREKQKKNLVIVKVIELEMGVRNPNAFLMF